MDGLRVHALKVDEGALMYRYMWFLPVDHLGGVTGLDLKQRVRG
jgi:hypothetical protein